MGHSLRVAARAVAQSEQFPAPCRQSRSAKRDYPYLCKPVVKVGKFMPQYMPKYGEFFAAISPKMTYTPCALQVPFPGTTCCTVHNSPHLVVVLSMWSGFA